LHLVLRQQQRQRGVVVRTLDGRDYAFDDAGPDTRVEEFRVAVKERWGYSRCSIRLVFAGKQLMDGKRLSEYSVGPGSTINLVLRGSGAKPAIYLYPAAGALAVTVALNFESDLGCVFPSFNGGGRTWSVTAHPGGSIQVGDNDVPYLFWEGEVTFVATRKGFVVPRADTVSFLEKTLKAIGLNEAETFEFVVYWAPKLTKAPANFISFNLREYDEALPLRVEPRPDTVLRVFMTYTRLASAEGVMAEPQEFSPPARVGFTLVEWGGGKLPTYPA
jgi:hypothetical protein